MKPRDRGGWKQGFGSQQEN